MTVTDHRPRPDLRLVGSVAEINEVRAREPQRIGALLASRAAGRLFGPTAG